MKHYYLNLAFSSIATFNPGSSTCLSFHFQLWCPHGREAPSSGIALLLSCYPRASGCLTAPQQSKGAQPKDCDPFDSKTIVDQSGYSCIALSWL
ncbi:hypothetical protein [Pontibacter pudoricolor]|uniref:hypothetical protein n=1 Tax=Pontibacter pudoricolor TaxID=2694930 RepID=UPI001390CA12|nr:hypothetical protein [Pontibacter pudoricolor]